MEPATSIDDFAPHVQKIIRGIRFQLRVPIILYGNQVEDDRYSGDDFQVAVNGFNKNTRRWLRRARKIRSKLNIRFSIIDEGQILGQNQIKID